MLNVWNQRTDVDFFAFSSWKFIKSTSALNNCDDSFKRIFGYLRVPNKPSRDILQQAKGIILIESTQIRWFLRWSSGGSWSGRAEAQRRPRVSKLRAKGLSDYHSSETIVEAARQGASGLNKRATLTTCLPKKGELKSSSLLFLSLSFSLSLWDIKIPMYISLILKVLDIVFFLPGAKHIMGHFMECFEGAKAFLIP